jgi:hypothetical protein
MMELKCCEHAMKITHEKVMQTLNKVLLDTPMDEPTRKAFIKQLVKELVKLGPTYASLVDLL